MFLLTLRTPHLLGWKFTHQSRLFTSSDVESTGLFLLKFDISLLQYHIFCVFYYIYIIHIITCDHIMIYHDNPHVLLYFWVESQRYPNNEVAITAHSTPSETLTPHEPSDLPEGIVRMKGGSQRAIRVCVKIVYP